MTSTRAGFTLIEIIVSLVVLGIVSSFAASYFNLTANNAAAPLTRLKATTDLVATMNTIVADFYATSDLSKHPNKLQDDLGTSGSKNAVPAKYKVGSGNYQSWCRELTYDSGTNTFSPGGGGAHNYVECTVEDSASGQSVTQIFSKRSS